VSCNTRSKELLERVIPVTPPTVKRNRKPYAQQMTLSIFTLLPTIMLSQEKIFTLVGTPITIVAAVKYIRVSTSIPTVNI
jgi:hypothetical protein